MLALARRWPDRIWAVEGRDGIGKHLAQRPVADGERRAGHARASSPPEPGCSPPARAGKTDAHSIAVAGPRSPGLTQVRVDDHLVALRLLADRRDELGIARTNIVNRSHRPLLELLPRGANKLLSATQAHALLASIRPRDLTGKPTANSPCELITELGGIHLTGGVPPSPLPAA